MTEESNGGVLQQLSDALAGAVTKAGESVVVVQARRRLHASGIAWGDGIIVTADHVIENDDRIVVGFPDGSEAKASVVGRDAGSDIAVLSVERPGLRPIEHGPETRVGNLVLAVGRPRPGDPMASFGIVSAIGGPWRTFRGSSVEGYLRSDTTFFPGFSGGPLVNATGQAVGLNSSRLGRGSGLTIPIAAVATVVEALRAGGKLKRGYLGIGSQAARLPEALSAKAGGQEFGLLVVGVEPGSPADHAGLLVGDILVRVADSLVTSTDDLQRFLGPQSVGQPLAVAVLRGGEPKDVTVTVGER